MNKYLEFQISHLILLRKMHANACLERELEHRYAREFASLIIN